MKSKSMLVVPATLAVVASALFLWQGGFGAGHGSFDRAIWFMGLPGTAVMMLLPFWPGDFLMLVLCPFVINFALWAAAIIIGRRLERRIS
jgi:hypothetical protein